MIDILNSYLVQHKSISIPGLGTIHLETHPAHADVYGSQILPPLFLYRFDKFHDTPVKEFFLFLADRKKIPEYEAIKIYNEYAAQFRSDIKLKEEAAWKNAGVFKIDDSGEIIFEQHHKPIPFFIPVGVNSVVEEPASIPAISVEEEVLDDIPEYRLSHDIVDEIKKNDWWIYALSLFVLALAVLWIHFYNKGMIWQAFFNQQPAF